jgi:diguanylate cyclase (GGDEF)-like protein
MPPTIQRSYALETGVVFGLQAVACGAVVYLHNLSVLTAAIQAIPLLIAAWLWGIRGGLAFTLAALLVDVGLAYLLGYTSAGIFIQHAGLFGIPASLLAAALVGKLGELTRRHNQEAAEYKRAMIERETHAGFMTLLNGIVRAALEAEDIPTLLKGLTDHTGELFSADECIILLHDDGPEDSRPLVAWSSTGKTYAPGADQSGVSKLACSVLKAERALAIEDLRKAPGLDADLAATFSHLRSLLCLPLIASGQNPGVLILGFKQAHPFSPYESQRGELAARQISLAMTKVLLLKDARNRVRELAGLHSIAQVFSVHGDDRRTYGTLTDTLAELMGTEICVICLVDPNSEELRTQVPAHGVGDDLASATHFSTDVVEQAWKHIGKNVCLANSLEEIPAEFAPQARAFNFKCVLIGLLQNSEGQRLGAIFAANKPGGFNEDDAHLLELFAEQVTIVIQDTLLLSVERKRAQELAVLHAVAAATTGADNEDQLIERVTNLIGEGLYQDSFEILLLDEAAGELYLHSWHYRGEAGEAIQVPLGIGITGAVAKSGKPRRVGDVSKAPEYLSAHPLTRSEMCIPLKVEKHVIGVANAESENPNAFTEQDEELLTILAGQVATAIQRLRTAKAEHYQAKQLERSNALIHSLAELGAKADATADPNGVMQTLGSELAKLAMGCLIGLSETGEMRVTIRYTSLPKRSVRTIERITGQKFFDAAIPVDRISSNPERAQNPSLIPDPTALVLNLFPGVSRPAAIKILKSIGIIETTSVCHLPLVIEGKPIGILWMWGEGLHESDLPTMSLFASQVAAALQNARLLTQVQRMAITDELTGIFNRRHFFNRAEAAFTQAKRYSHPLAALIVDIDHFKQFNDRYGHLVGDRVLREVARLLQDSLRGCDILGRYGGEEFSVVLPDTEMEAAVSAARRLLTHVAETPIQTEAGELHVQLSIGVSGLCKETSTLHALINRADQAMYMAKDAGRNRVAVK